MFYFSTILAFLVSCQSPQVEIIDAAQLKALQQSGVEVIDVRTAGEYAAGHLPGVGKNIDFFDRNFLEKMKEINEEQPIIIHCKKGGRSSKAAQLLIANGFTKVYDYAGGYSDWVNRGERVEK